MNVKGLSDLAKVKGLGDLATTQNIFSRPLPSTRAQKTAELARMENEKARLRRELSMWIAMCIANEKHAQNRLRQVQKRIGLLQRALDDESEEGTTETTEKEKPGGRQWRELRLEY